MNKFRAQFGGSSGVGACERPYAAADAVASFQNDYAQRSAPELARCGQTGRTCADYDDVGVHACRFKYGAREPLPCDRLFPDKAPYLKRLLQVWYPLRMTRTVDERRRVDLLERIVDYVAENGVSELSLRPLAAAVDASPRLLLYYFESKEALLTEILVAVRSRQRVAFAKLSDVRGSSGDVCRAAWRIMSDRKSEPLFRLLFEVYALALVDRKRFPDFLKHVVADWLDFLERPALAEGCSATRARAYATVVLAGFRGFMLDLCATRERARVDLAVNMWIEMLSSASLFEESQNARTA